MKYTDSACRLHHQLCQRPPACWSADCNSRWCGRPCYLDDRRWCRSSHSSPRSRNSRSAAPEIGRRSSTGPRPGRTCRLSSRIARRHEHPALDARIPSVPLRRGCRICRRWQRQTHTWRTVQIHPATPSSSATECQNTAWPTPEIRSARNHRIRTTCRSMPPQPAGSQDTASVDTLRSDNLWMRQRQTQMPANIWYQYISISAERWHGGTIGRASDLQFTGHWFKSWLAFDKLPTPVCLCDQTV